MNHADVIRGVSQKCGLYEADCNRIVKAFEEESGALIGKRDKSPQVIAKVAAASGAPEEDCEKVLKALDEVLGEGLADKLQFWKRGKKEQ